MKLLKVVLIGFVLVSASCSKDDDAKPNLEKAKISFLESNAVITPPAKMAASDDHHAQLAVVWIESANIMSAYASFFDKPNGATKSSTKITAANGRTGATGDHVTYVWGDVSQGLSIAYQVSELSDRYVFELFFKFDSDNEWLKYLNIEEKKDRSQGSMKIYDVYGFTGSHSAVLFGYTWSRSGDMFTLTMSDYEDKFEVVLQLNEKTKAGSLIYKIDNKKEYEMVWDAVGNGSYTYYDSEGNVESSGTWAV